VYLLRKEDELSPYRLLKDILGEFYVFKSISCPGLLFSVSFRFDQSSDTKTLYQFRTDYYRSIGLATAVSQAAVPAGFKQAIVVKNLINPTRMAIAPDGCVFITEQAGRIRIVESGSLLPQPFLNISTAS
jgi:hypothetical protein